MENHEISGLKVGDFCMFLEHLNTVVWIDYRNN